MSYNRDAIPITSSIAAAARALAMGDALGALKRVALREDAPALALRGIAMAQLGELGRAKALLRRAARAFGPGEPAARARCVVAEAEVALASRELGSRGAQALESAVATLEAHGDRRNAAYARCLLIRRLLLLGRLDEAERALAELRPTRLPPAIETLHQLVVAGIAMRRIRARAARTALARARRAAGAARIPALLAEIDGALRALGAPVGRLIERGAVRPLVLAEVEALLASPTLVVDACGRVVRDGSGGPAASLAKRPVSFALARALGEAWPGDVTRDALVRVFGAKGADGPGRARLRVEVARLRAALRSVAGVRATERGFVLAPRRARKVVVLAPPVEGEHGAVLALLADGQSWSSSALALALGTSQRTVQRALDALAAEGKVRPIGRGRARRWVTSTLPGFTTPLLLPAPLAPTGMHR